MASKKSLRLFISCYHTCSTNDPSFIIGSCQVRFLQLIYDHSVTTYSALDGTHVSPLCHKKTRLALTAYSVYANYFLFVYSVHMDKNLSANTLYSINKM